MDRPDETFLQESRANLRTLSDGLLSLEREHDAETVDEMFRAAHSLKGTCRTVGLTDTGALAHTVEDVLDALRAGDAEASPALVDAALAAVDDLEESVEAAAAGTDTPVDPLDSEASLREALDAHRREATESAGADPDERPPDGGDGRPPAGFEDESLSDDVRSALADATEFDDIDSLVDEMDDADDGPLDDWGVLDDGHAPDATTEAPAESESGAPPDNPESFFEQIREDVDDENQDVDDLQRDIDAVEFGEFDEEDDLTIEELIDLEPATEPPAGDAPDPAAPDVGAVDEDTAADVDASAPPSPTTPDEFGEDPTPPPTDAVPPTEAESVADASADEPATRDEPEEPPTTAGEPTTADEPEEPPTAADEPTTADEASEVPPGASASDDGEPVDTSGETTEDAGGFVFDVDRADDAADDPEEPPTAADEPTTADVPDEPTTAADDPTPESVPEDAVQAPSSDPAATEPTAESGVDPFDAADEDVPAPDSLPDMDLESADLSVDAADDDVPAPDSLPDLDVESADLSVDADAPETAALDVELDAEMTEFESRFQGALDPSAQAAGSGDAEQDVFLSAVTTIEESRLDAERYGTTEDRDASGVETAGRLPPMTVTVETADRLMNLAEEMSIARHNLDAELGDERSDALDDVVADLQQIVTDYRRTVTEVRLMPLEDALTDVPRTVRDVARAQEKDVTLDVEDADVRLDRGVIEKLHEPLVHLARNAVDHGIEPPAERVAAGKPPEGRIELHSEQVRDEVVIELSDDGRGIDVDELRAAAVERGRLSAADADRLTEAETYDLLFEAGVSTAEAVTDVSGRGVGMDVVDRIVTALDGRIEVESDPGEGTTVRMVVPVSLALTEVLFVEVGDEQFGVPLDVVQGITDAPDLSADRTTVRPADLSLTPAVEGLDPGDTVPLVRLGEALNVAAPSAPDASKLAWVRTESGPCAVEFDRIGGSREVVIRPYEGLLRNIPGIQGATIRADERPVNVLDVETL